MAIWTVDMAPGAIWKLPAATSAGIKRTLYLFRGQSMRVAGQEISGYSGVELRGDRAVTLQNGVQRSELLLLQGRPIEQPVAQHGPFVMNTPAEIQQAFADYRRTGFGGWPWSSDAPVHPRERGRFARHADGHLEEVG